MDASVAESLSCLETDYLDLLLIHWPVDNVPLEEQIESLVALKESGKARAIGVSNFPVAMLEEAYRLSGRQIINSQVEYHPFISQKPVIDFVHSKNMFLTAYSPLARGKVLEDPVINEIAEKHGKSATQISLRWLLDQDGVAAIPKAAKTEHMESNFDIFDFELDDDDNSRLSELQKQQERLIDPSWAPRWDDAEKAAA
jgi:2,5-diketo-D-gluconate reductase B